MQNLATVAGDRPKTTESGLFRLADGWALTLFTALLLVLSSIPHIMAYIMVPADRHYMGIVSNVSDWSQYLSWLKAFQKHWVVINSLTPEPQQALFFNIQWWILAQLTWLLDLRPDVTIQVLRTVALIAFVLITFRLCKFYFGHDRLAYWTAFLVVNLFSGLGWLLVVVKQFRGDADVMYPLSVYVAEPMSFQNMIIYPHFLVAVTLMLLTFKFFADALTFGKVRDALIAAGFALILGLSHAYDLLIVYSVLGLVAFFYALLYGAWRNFIIAYSLLLLISIAPPAYFAVLTSHDPVWTEVLAQFKNAGVFTPDPLLLHVLMGVPLFLAWIGLGSGQQQHIGTPVWRLLIRVWFVVNLLLNYIPTDYQIHMLSGWQIPTGILAVEFVVFRLPAVLSRQDALLARVRTVLTLGGRIDLRRLLATLVIVSVLPHNIYLTAWRMLDIGRLEHGQFLYEDEMMAMRWLEANTKPDDVVLAGIEVGQHVPGLAGNQSYLAHWAQTVRFFERRASVKAFFKSETSDAQRKAILSDQCVAYVWHGREERALGSADLASMEYLSKVWSAGTVSLYHSLVCRER